MQGVSLRFLVSFRTRVLLRSLIVIHAVTTRSNRIQDLSIRDPSHFKHSRYSYLNESWAWKRVQLNRRDSGINEKNYNYRSKVKKKNFVKNQKSLAISTRYIPKFYQSAYRTECCTAEFCAIYKLCIVYLWNYYTSHLERKVPSWLTKGTSISCTIPLISKGYTYGQDETEQRYDRNRERLAYQVAKKKKKKKNRRTIAPYGAAWTGAPWRKDETRGTEKIWPNLQTLYRLYMYTTV